MTRTTSQASVVWKHFNGIICVYKTAGHSWERCLASLQNKIVSGLNQLQCREPQDYVRITGDTSKPVDVTLETNYADHPLVVGPRYIPDDVCARPLRNVGVRTSGVCLIGIQHGIRTIQTLAQKKPISTYRVVGQFGLSTNNRAVDGDIIYTSNYNYLRKERIDKVIATIQSIHRKHLIQQCGFHPSSQQAYDLLASGNLRPLATDIPVLYSIKCIDWKLPYFTVEIVIVNEDEDYILNLIHEIGVRAKNIAVGCSIRCLRCSVFSIEDALLEKHWDIQNLLNNMDLCRRKLKSIEGDDTPYFRQIDSGNVDDINGDTSGHISEEIIEEEWKEF